MKPSSTLACRATEIILLSDISDVYNVSTGHDPHEFIIRKIRQGSTLYFTSPYRDAIVKVGRSLSNSYSVTYSACVRRFVPPRVASAMSDCQLQRGFPNSQMSWLRCFILACSTSAPMMKSSEQQVMNFLWQRAHTWTLTDDPWHPRVVSYTERMCGVRY